jgi:carbonic anhydrase
MLNKKFVLCLLLFPLFTTAAKPMHMTSQKAITSLKEGNKRFYKGLAIHPRQNQSQRNYTNKKQQPFATILGCSDSRVPIEEIFDQGIGDVFTIRVAGNVISPDVIGSLEYGAYLATPIIVILGHTHCDAVTAAYKNPVLKSYVKSLIAKIKPVIKKTKQKYPTLHGDAFMNKAIEANVWQSSKALLTKSTIIRNKVKNKKLKLIGAIYDIKSGKVKWLGEYKENL